MHRVPADGPRASPHSLVRRALFSLALVLVLLVAVELVLRARTTSSASPFQRMVPAIAEDRAGRYGPHEDRIYTLAPHFRHSASHLGRDATGDWPFRGRPPEPAAPGLLRVAVIGDSIVYGSSLDAADMPGSCLARSLAERGWTPDRVAVLSLGVPGYSTVQLNLLRMEDLVEHHPDAVVLWPAAWNDQAPALKAPDMDLIFPDQTALGWMCRRSRLVNQVAGGRELPLEEILEGWKHGRPPNGYRVDASEVKRLVGHMLSQCEGNGVPVIVVAAAHPPQTAADHPRTRTDAATVLAEARLHSVPTVDAQALIESAGLGPSRAFVDYVHPSPAANALVGAAVADALVPVLDACGIPRAARGKKASIPADPPLSIVEAQPRVVPVLGDATLHVTLSGWARGERLPAVIVGGAPLIDVRATREHEVAGTLMANAPGRHELVVQSAQGCAWLPDAIEYVEPAIAIDTPPGEALRLVVSSRPGDAVRVFVATGRTPDPSWSPRGAYWLDASAKALPGDRVADGQGRATWTFDQPPPGTFLVQALVAPAGEAPDEGLASRWTSVVELAAAAPAPTPPSLAPR